MLEVPLPATRSSASRAPFAPRTGPRVVAAATALVAAVGVHLTWRVFVATVTGQRLDEQAWGGAGHGQYRLWTLAEPVLDVVSVSFVVLGIATAMLICVIRRRWMLAAQVAVLIGGSNATTQLLKYWVYDRPHLLPGWSGPNSLPSGHTTVAASVAVGLLVAVPRAWRPAAAVLGALWTAATGVSTLIGQWHRPSDVVAAVLVVAVWAGAVCALATRSTLDVGPRDRASMAGSYVAASVLGVVGVGTGAVAALALEDVRGGVATVPFGVDVTAYAGGVAGVVAVTALVFAVVLLVRQATAQPVRRP